MDNPTPVGHIYALSTQDGEHFANVYHERHNGVYAPREHPVSQQRFEWLRRNLRYALSLVDEFDDVTVYRYDLAAQLERDGFAPYWQREPAVQSNRQFDAADLMPEGGD